MTDRFEDPAARFFELMPFTRTLGIELVAASTEEVVARLAWLPERCTAGGVLHGGAVMALADSTGGMCASLLFRGDTTGTTTVESKTNFLRAIRAGYAEARSRPLHAGRTVVVVETEVRDPEGRLAAKVTQSQLVLRG